MTENQHPKETEYSFYIDNTPLYIPKNEEERLEMERIVNEIVENYSASAKQENMH
jgi:hypothetical protein